MYVHAFRSGNTKLNHNLSEVLISPFHHKKQHQYSTRDTTLLLVELHIVAYCECVDHAK